ncbi:hypothetical protein Pint_26466 [Pistacia integerrima]|uniref:Uncharacterized protein n=1 Tax=Pistacia integerrima TaxID=434235 RepID=A0ACC0YDV2_9ROSI|nr:hypothetical protein Pint_26466 [Pistacia integerrima]
MALNLKTPIYHSPSLGSSPLYLHGFSSKPFSISFPHSLSLTGFAIGTQVAFERKDRFLVVKTAAMRQLTGSLTRSEGFRFAVGCGAINEIVTKPLLKGALEINSKYIVYIWGSMWL